MKVLVYCPLNPKTPKVFGRTVESIFGMHWLEPLDIVFGRDDEPDPKRSGWLNLLDKYNHAREMVLTGGYDALLTIEADMIVPETTLERLSRVEADVAYGLYCTRHAKNDWLVATVLRESPPIAVWLSHRRDLATEAWGNVIESKGVGMGCTFIRRHVLEKIEFRCPAPKVANDWYFAVDCAEAGFVQKHDCGVVCGHITMTPSPRVIWPAIDDPQYLSRIEFLG